MADTIDVVIDEGNNVSDFDSIMSRKYALEESIDHGYSPTPEEEEWMNWAEEKLADWASDVEPVY